jgi:branched-chain amino acid transport system permease protein
MLVFAIACLALNLLYGTAGSLSLGHATCFGAAAYTGAFVYRFTSASSFEAYLASGLLSAAIFATVIGYLCARSTKIFFALLTLSFSMVVHALVIDGAVFQLLGGVGWALYLLGEGSMYIPRLTILGAEIPASDFIAAFYYVIVAAFMISALMLWRVSVSPFGQALRAIRDNELRAHFIGIPVWQYRWRAWSRGQPLWAAGASDHTRAAALAVLGKAHLRHHPGGLTAFPRPGVGRLRLRAPR